ncbi:MAG: hypothetical protein U0835_00365 [Isosphaeraceae bacterium]
MTIDPTEFRCPDFLLVEAGDRFHLFRPDDTIGEQIDRSEAEDLVLGRLIRRPIPPLQLAAYRPARLADPRHVDDRI